MFMIETKSPAKINLGLKVIGKRMNGYHLLDTIFASVDLYDEIIIKEVESDKIEITSNNNEVPLDSTNLIVKTLNSFGIDKGLRIYLNKNIPIGGGMGGGSSNAAAILRLLPRLGVNVSEDKIKETARSLGADVYYCYVGGIQRASGVGEILKPINASNKLPKIAVLPQTIHCDTKKIFNHYDKSNIDSYTGDLNNVEKGLVNGDFSLINKSISNSLERTIFDRYKILKERVNYLRDKNLNIQISGSGSTLYMVLKNEHDIIKLKKVYKDKIMVCNILNNM